MINRDTAIHALLDFDSGTTVRVTMRIGLDLDAVLTESYRIIHADRAPILEAEQGLDLHIEFAINRARLLRGDPKSAVVAWQKLQ